MAEWLDETEQATWRSFLRMHANLMRAVGERLQADSGMSLPDFEVLAMLSEAPDAELRERDLCFELQWEESRLARHVRELQERGLLQRDGHVDGGQSPMISLTEAGRAAVDAAAPAHVARVRELFFDVLSLEQVQVMGDAAAAVLENVAGVTDTDDKA